MKDNLDNEPCPEGDTRTLQLSIGNPIKVITRSSALNNERLITDAYLLVFGTNGKYKNGEKINVSTAISNNGSQSPVLTTSLIIQTGEIVCILANTGCTFTTIPLTAGSSVESDINTAFPSTGWNINQSNLNSGQGMPLYGRMIYGNETQCQLYRAVAKIQVALSGDIASNDVTGQFTKGNASLTYCIANIPSSTCGNIVNNGTISVPSTISFIQSGYTQHVIGSEASASQSTYYMTEYGSSTLAKGTTVDISKWHPDRPCIIMKDANNKFYRLDLYQLNGTTKQFIDLKRNTHIIVTINKVRSEGYATEEEALKNPGSNLVYDITLDDEISKIVKSNGQYALVLSNDGKLIYGPNDTYEIAKVKYKLGNDFGSSLPESSVTTDVTTTTDFEFVISDLDGSNEEVINGNARKFSNTDKVIKLKVKNNSTAASMALYLRVGNIYDTILVERHPILTLSTTTANDATGSLTSMVWQDNPADITVATSNSKLAFSVPKSQMTKRSQGYLFGSMKTANSQSAKKVAQNINVEIIRQGTSIENVLTFKDCYGQNSIVYIGQSDNDNFFKGDGWIDDPEWSPNNAKDLGLPVFKFTPQSAITLTSPNTSDLMYSSSSESIDAWKNSTGSSLINRNLTIAAGKNVTIALNFTKGAYTYKWTVVDNKNGGDPYYISLNRQQNKAPAAQTADFIKGFAKYINVEHIFSAVGEKYVLNTSTASTAKTIGINANETVVANVSLATTDKELGYRADRVLVRNDSNQLVSYYISQNGTGYAMGTIKMAVIRPAQGTDGTDRDWGFYIPSGNSAIDNIYTSNISQDVVFMIGTTEALEIPSNVSTLSSGSWDQWSNRYSWVTYDKPCSNGEAATNHQRYTNPAIWPNNQGLYPMINKPYEHFEYNGSGDPCQYVYPKGYWRKPTSEEVASYAPAGETYPYINSYNEGIEMSIHGTKVNLIAPYMMLSDGVYSGKDASNRGLRSIMIGPFYYIYAITNNGLHDSYPLKYKGKFNATSAPAQNVATTGYNYRDACAVFCIRN